LTPKEKKKSRTEETRNLGIFLPLRKEEDRRGEREAGTLTGLVKFSGVSFSHHLQTMLGKILHLKLFLCKTMTESETLPQTLTQTLM